MCTPTQKKLCGKKECQICYGRSLQKYLDESGLQDKFIKCIDDNSLTSLTIAKGSNKKCEFKCKKCDRIYISMCNKYTKSKGCSNCSGNKKSNTEEFIHKAIQIHGNTYDYSMVNYMDLYIHYLSIYHISNVALF